jgi:hypothetical protein
MTPPDRESLDEALFASGEPIAAPPVPDEALIAPDEPLIAPDDPPPEPPRLVYPTHMLLNDVAPILEDDPPPRAEEELPPPEPEPPAEEPAPLVVEVNAGLTLTAGESAPITPDLLHVTGPREPHLVELMLLSPPLAGAVLRDGFALTGGDVFTREDVDQGRVSYRHAGGDEAEDAFTFASPDGAVPPTVFAVTIKRPRRVLPLPPPLPPVAEPWAAQPTAAELAGDGLAVVRLVGEGTWLFSLDDGGSWSDFGPVYHGRARLLRPGDRVRFLPRPGWSGRVALAGRTWDGTGGAAGGTANLAARSACAEGAPFGERVLARSWYRVAA